MIAPEDVTQSSRSTRGNLKKSPNPANTPFAVSWISAATSSRLLKEIAEDRDSLRFYFLGDNWKGRVEHVGTKESYDSEGPLVV